MKDQHEAHVLEPNQHFCNGCLACSAGYHKLAWNSALGNRREMLTLSSEIQFHGQRAIQRQREGFKYMSSLSSEPGSLRTKRINHAVTLLSRVKEENRSIETIGSA